MVPASLLSSGGEEVLARKDFWSPSNTRIPTHPWPPTAMGRRHPVENSAGHPQHQEEGTGSEAHGQGVASPRGMFRVYGYYPSEGPVGSSINVALNFHARTTQSIFLRVLVGSQALSTAVQQYSQHNPGAWELQATAPQLDTSATTVPLSVQALNGSNEVLDEVTFGQFTYVPTVPFIKRDESEDMSIDLSAPASQPSHKLEGDSPSDILTRPSSGASNSRSRRTRGIQPPRGLKKQAILRTSARNLPHEAGGQPHHAPLLELVTPLESMCKGWDEEELGIGRRLIHFSRKQEGHTLIVSCEPIKQKDYVEGDTVISCIYRADTDNCFVTSVDIIFLLESLVGEGFDIEEKNRIRRNLEGFRPKTVSKNRIGSEEFFQQIMDFPVPKPRNIEKDLKVFDWKVLPQALEKIISKYSIYPAPLTDIVKAEYLNFKASQPSTSTSSIPLTPDTPLSPPLETPRDFTMSHPAVTDLASYHCIPSETIYAEQFYTRHPNSKIRDDVLQYEDHSPMPFLACPTPTRSFMPFGSQNSISDGSNRNTSDTPYNVGYDSPILRPGGDSQGNLYHHTTIPSPSHGFSSPGTLDMGTGMATFDSVEFQTLREHNVTSATAESPYTV